MREGAADQVREDLLDDGVVAALCFGLDPLERRVSEQGVVAQRPEPRTKPLMLVMLPLKAQATALS